MGDKKMFMCIGAQKSGTTWLHRQLRNHPQIWLPPVKELHYFDTIQFNNFENYRVKRLKRYNKIIERYDCAGLSEFKKKNKPLY